MGSYGGAAGAPRTAGSALGLNSFTATVDSAPQTAVLPPGVLCGEEPDISERKMLEVMVSVVSLSLS